MTPTALPAYASSRASSAFFTAASDLRLTKTTLPLAM
jgi:hypothetical protein